MNSKKFLREFIKFAKTQTSRYNMARVDQCALGQFMTHMYGKRIARHGDRSTMVNGWFRLFRVEYPLPVYEAVMVGNSRWESLVLRLEKIKL